MKVPGRPVLAHAADAVVAGDLVFVAGLLPVDADGGLVGEGSPEIQARFVLGELERVLAAAGCAPTDLVRTNAYVTRAEGVESLDRAWDDLLGGASAALTTVVVPALAIDGAEVEIDAVAVRR